MRCGRAEEGRRSARYPQKSLRREVENGRDLSGRRSKRSQEDVGSVDVEYLDHRKKAEREAQGAQG